MPHSPLAACGVHLGGLCVTISNFSIVFLAKSRHLHFAPSCAAGLWLFLVTLCEGSQVAPEAHPGLDLLWFVACEGEASCLRATWAMGPLGLGGNAGHRVLLGSREPWPERLLWAVRQVLLHACLCCSAPHVLSGPCRGLSAVCARLLLLVL